MRAKTILMPLPAQDAGHSVLRGRRGTSLLRSQELAAWCLTAAWLGRDYRTYPQTVEAEVRAALGPDGAFLPGPTPLARDTEDRPRGFVVRDRNYLSARWPGDAWAFSAALLDLLR